LSRRKALALIRHLPATSSRHREVPKAPWRSRRACPALAFAGRWIASLGSQWRELLNRMPDNAFSISGMTTNGLSGFGMTDISQPEALFFDVFGTAVDWRTSVIREMAAFGHSKGLTADWAAFADRWRGKYQPAMEEVRSGRRLFTILDVLHRESLIEVLREVSITGLSEDELGQLTTIWHRLDPWPDAVGGLIRLKRRYIISPLSNGNVALMTRLSKHAGLPWDVILGAETAQAYKPVPQAYLRNAAFLALAPEACMLVAAHNNDLAAARAIGFKTAFVLRPTEHGPNQQTDLRPEADWDIVAASFEELADKLHCLKA
jgi:2-haloacid dehalogenase